MGVTDLQFLTSHGITSLLASLRTENTLSIMKNIIAGRRKISETGGVAYSFFLRLLCLENAI